MKLQDAQKLNNAPTPATEPRFKWVFSSIDMYWELREVGESHSYATVYYLRAAGDMGADRRRARKAGYNCSLHVSGISGPVAYCKEPQDAKKLGRELAAEEMATKNTVAWDISRPAREAARRAEEEARAEATRLADVEAAKKRAILRDALDQYVTNTEAALENGDETDPRRLATMLENCRLGQSMLDDLNAQVAAEADRS